MLVGKGEDDPMNTMQIKCFLAVAETLNFTKAAEQLYITQPGLGKQIVSLEKELNTLLFIRDKKKVRLTPAAAYLAKELPKVNKQLNGIVENVQRIGQGYIGKLSIGTLGGQWAGDSFSDYLNKFIDNNPNINLSLKQGSFKDLRDWLDSGEIDIALTLPLDIKNKNDYLYEIFEKDNAVFAISKKRPVCKKKTISIEDLNDETFICISEEDSPEGYNLCQNFFKRNDFRGQITIAQNLLTVMMLIETGRGFGIINHKSSITHNSSIRVLEEIKMPDDGASSCFAWKKTNINPAISLFLGHN